MLCQRAAPVPGPAGAEQAGLQRGVAAILELFTKLVERALVEHNVGVDEGDVGGPRQLGAELARHWKALPLVGHHDGAVLARDLDRPVGRLPIHHDDRPRLLPHRGFHARGEQPLGVADGDDDREVSELDVVVNDAHELLSADAPSGAVTAASWSTMTSEA